MCEVVGTPGTPVEEDYGYASRVIDSPPPYSCFFTFALVETLAVSGPGCPSLVSVTRFLIRVTRAWHPTGPLVGIQQIACMFAWLLFL